MFLKIIVGGGILVCLFGCAPKLLIKDDIATRQIAVCLDINASISDSLKSDIDSVTKRFIEDYNSQNRKYELIPCRNDESKTIFLDVLTVRITGPAQQAAGVGCTVLGAITPFILIAMNSPVYIWFAYLPRSSMQIAMKLSKDISEQSVQRTRRTFVGSGKYFGSFTTQKELLMQNYYNRLKEEMKGIETKYKN